ncbi:hypothetical protein ACFSUS_00980 [Spirosoma soli]|uniref:Outer membrane protein beta-barrel domain-containing protein n=1 Tax=Spirosoma soli TaxID=1770529 RepID=A0ABW5LX49_9BACT
MSKCLTFVSAWALVLLVANGAYCQDVFNHKYWLGLGIGKSQFPSGMVALGYEFNNSPTLVTARYTFNGEVLPDNVPAIAIHEFGLLYGLKTGKFRFSTGVSGVWGTNRGKYLSSDPDPLINGSNIYEPIKYATIGLPAEIRFITSTKDLGIGVTGFGNLNAKRSFIGLNLSLYVGKMK